MALTRAKKEFIFTTAKSRSNPKFGTRVFPSSPSRSILFLLFIIIFSFYIFFLNYFYYLFKDLSMKH